MASKDQRQAAQEQLDFMRESRPHVFFGQLTPEQIRFRDEFVDLCRGSNLSIREIRQCAERVIQLLLMEIAGEL